MFAPAKFIKSVPDSSIAIETDRPSDSFAEIVRYFYADAMRPAMALSEAAISAAAHIDPGAKLEDGIRIEPGAVIGRNVEIGSGSTIGANTVVGPDVRIGRNCDVSANCSIRYALIGDHVIFHPGVRIGQDGFGFSASAAGPVKIPQVGRIIIQDHVEIGANSTVDRGAIRDTVIGEGTKIDNLVQVGHNVVIGRACILVGQSGVAGSSTLEDGVIIGGKVGISGHLTVGRGATIAGTSNVNVDVPPGEIWGGTPAKPVRQAMRELKVLERLAKGKLKT